MENLLDGWGITLATFSPLVGAAVMMLIPREREDQHKLIALCLLYTSPSPRD